MASLPVVDLLEADVDSTAVCDTGCPAAVDLLAGAISHMADLLDTHAEGLDIVDREMLNEGVRTVQLGAAQLRSACRTMNHRLEHKDNPGPS